MTTPVLSRVASWVRIAGERRRLANLPPHILADIGVGEAEAGAEARRPFWDLPAGRRTLR